MELLLQGKNLRKSFDNGETVIEVLRGIDINIFKKELVAIKGPSGSGKSTLLYSLSSLNRISSGEIIYLEENLNNKSDKYLSKLRRKEFGFIFQFFNLIQVLTVKENIVLPLTLDGRIAEKGMVETLLMKLGIEDLVNCRPFQISGGQQQRVAIARALINDSKIIFADEPTGSLDSKSGIQVIKLLRDIVDTFGKSVLVVTHDDKIADFADRIIELEDGLIKSNYIKRKERKHSYV